MGIKEQIIDWYLTRKTGMDAEQRAWKKWQDENIAFRSNTIQGVLKIYKHVIEVSANSFFDHKENGAWIPVEDWEKYAYPEKQLGENAMWLWARGFWGTSEYEDGKYFFLNEIAGGDHVFIGTNSDDDAVYFSLRFS